MNANTPKPLGWQDPVISADSAFEAFSALRRLAQSEPHLIENEYFTALQDTAYARFMAAFEVAT